MPAWNQMEYALPLARAFAAAATYNGFLFVVGGADEVTAPFATYRNQILRARISPDGKLNQWTVIGVLAGDKLSPSLHITDTGTMYVIGGNTDADSGSVTEGHDVLMGKLSPEGDLMGAGLQALDSLPVSVNSSGICIHNGFLYVVGGNRSQAEIDYVAGTGDFQVGEVVTGQTSGATATVQTIISDGGDAGSLGVEGVVGTFSSGELLHGDLGGRARSDGGSGDIMLDYSLQANDFTLASTIEGVTSGATAVVDADADAGTTGTLTVSSVTGLFQAAEDVRTRAGAALANGTLYKTLGYGSQVANFGVGQVVTGATSGTVGTVFADADGGATGVLSMRTSTITGADYAGFEWIHGDENSRAVANSAPVHELDWANQTVAFVDAEVITGGTSGATATIVSGSGPGATGTWVLTSVTGNFVNGEVLTGSIAGAAEADGTNRQTFTYQTQTLGNFVVGQKIFGNTLEVHGTVANDVDGGTTGTLTIEDATGDFSNGDVLIGFLGGAATVTATLSNAMLDYDGRTGTWDISGSGTLLGLSGAATAVIDSDVDAGGGAGTLTLSSVVGTFADNEGLRGYSPVNAQLDGTTYTDLDFVDQTGAWAVGENVLGLTSGATARIASDDGAIILADLSSGTFSNAETLAGDILGQAVADGDSVLSVDTNPVIYRARLDSNGGVGAWQSFGLLPGTISGATSLVGVGDHLYLVGGNELIWTRIGVNAIESWNRASVPADVSSHGLVGIGNKLVLCGGEVSASDTGKVYVLSLGGDGAPTGSWIRTADMPVARSRFGIAVDGDRIWVCGGRATAAATTSVVTARLQDGLIGGEKI